MNSALLTRSGLSLDRLASLVALADARGVSAAARGDPARQSQFSRQLKELEAFFGVALVERRRGVFRLTPAGRELVEIARTALTRLEDFGRRSSVQPIEVHLGAGESVLVWWLTPRLGPLLERHPEFAFSLHNLQSSEIIAQLRDGRLDLGILRRAAVAPGLASLALGEATSALFLPRERLPKAGPASLERLLGELPLALLEGSHAVNEALTAWADEHGVRLNLRWRCTSLVQAAAAVQHLGMAAVLPVWAESAFAPGQVVRLELPVLASLNVPLRLVWSRRQAAVRPFLSSLAKALAASLTHAAKEPSHRPAGTDA